MKQTLTYYKFNNKMKKLFFLLTMLIGIMLVACSDELNIDAPTAESINNVVDNHRISNDKAVEIANNFISGIDMSDERKLHMSTINCVVTEQVSRGKTTSPDTLAYVINYPDDNGFVIVCADDRKNPILAFSETGSFSFENEAVMENFIANLKPYVEKVDTFDIDYGLLLEDGFKQVPPKIKTILDQRSPFDKYVIEENPGCPVGCVAVASALIMSHCESELEFNGHRYVFPSIVEAIYNYQQPFDKKLATHGLYSEISYDEAIDEMAFLLYEIGKEVKMQYHTNASGAYEEDAVSMLIKSGYDLRPDSIDFDDNVNQLTDCLINDNLALTFGTGHCWVIDGVYYKIDKSTIGGNYTNQYYHCDWGWNGYSNGYYTGEVFTIANGTNMRPWFFYPVKANIKY